MKIMLRAGLLAMMTLLANYLDAQSLSGYAYKGAFDAANAIVNNTQFNGYTNHWQDKYKQWIRYGNLYKISMPNLAPSIAQSKIDIAEDMKLPGLQLQEGFVSGLLSAPYNVLQNPSAEELEKASGNTLVVIDSVYATAQVLTGKLPADSPWGSKLKSHQYQSPGFAATKAFILEGASGKLFVIAAPNKADGQTLLQLVTSTADILKNYDLHKGWFGAETLLKSVTCTQGHPLELIGRGMNEGNDWFTFSGYMDFLMKEELDGWMQKAGNPVVTDVGFSPIYGLNNYHGLQVQDMGGKDNWINFAHKNGGYAFRPVYDPPSNAYQFDGYLASEGNKEQIDNENIPFVASTGVLSEDALSSMVLFTNKGEVFTKAAMWQAILQRKEVAVLAEGKMMGPAYFRNALQLLLLDRFFLEEYFGDRIDLQANMEGYTLNVVISNHYDKPISGTLDIQLPPELQWANAFTAEQLNLPANSTKTIQLAVRPRAAGMDKTNPVLINYKWGNKTKRTLAMLDLPVAIAAHRLLYGHAPVVQYPVSVHNFSTDVNFPVQVQVFEKGKSGKPVFNATQKLQAATGGYAKTVVELKLPAGDYDVKVSALGVNTTTQLGVGKNEGKAFAYELDLNADGIKEYRLENDSVQVTLLATGARIIEYIVKSRKDNLLFKLWPEKPEDDKRLFRKNGFYPYGGFEDFLGQGSMETHQVYDAKLVKKEGDYVQVIMTADYFGNRLEKTYTLYGNSPLVEVRYALNFINPEANVIGPQPILELGKVHGTEDVFMAPDKDGMLQVRMRPEEYFGRLINLKEGWNAGYDTKEDISFVGAYPVTQPLFLHMWMNHPSNGESHYYYTEFQPWVPIIQKTTMYFTYYLWGAGGSWEESLQALRKRNLITERK
jgi:hypothetical protein